MAKTDLDFAVRGRDIRTSDVQPLYPVGSHLLMGVAYDLPSAIRSVSHDDMARWGVSEALEIARQSLQETPTTYAFSLPPLRGRGGWGVAGEDR